ncbi:hypothetical protein BDN70DRAFT_929929 [Pholiota conissans]|uniref:DNA polymerase delta subunit 3 n=1 Tax=Pholiota conissans TaxID=109636 RepID=A0A9P5Z9A2_9AGAR|nr:hypothetical protein BDN70DRAFT_929929 [Pholiota conissans]
MTTQAISDYLTKQLFIEGNIVTYRSLSRQFSIHVNEAKNELARYHHDAPYQSQKCLATFLLSGIPRRQDGHNYDEDVDMDGIRNPIQEEEEGEEVPQTTITIVNERDLEAAKASYAEIMTIHMYSISPAPIHDAGLICTPTETVQNTDREKGPSFSVKLGRIVGKGIKMGASKKKILPIAGPSKLKAPEPKSLAKTESKEATTIAAPDKGKEKPKVTGNGKLQFFSKSKEPAKAAKNEETSAVDTRKKMFFSKPAPVNAPAVAMEVDPVVKSEAVESVAVPTEKTGPSRGVKRKSSVGLQRKEKSSENVTPPAVDTNSTRARRRVLLSDDESDTAAPKPARRKSRVSYNTESNENSEAEREAMALMDIDDDQVERVSRVPSTRASSNELEADDGDGEGASSGTQDEDVSMEDEAPVKPKRMRKPKIVIPVGRNGLNKRKVTKTRRTMDANGYMHKEDYSDWESVEEGDEPEPEPVKAKGKAKAKVAVKEEEEGEDSVPPPPRIVKEKTKEKEPAPVKKAPAKPAATKTKPSGKGVSVKGKQQTLNFFGSKKT